MLGGFAEVYAYGSDLSSPVSPCCSGVGGGDCGTACDASSAIFGGFRNPYALPEDFILIAECNENSGPVPLAIIPKGSGRGIDLNAVTLKLLSSDYQGFGTASSVPIEDTQSLFPDVIPNIHAVVNYFALADVHSRGYVRPLCVAYLSSDKFKLIQTFLPLRESLIEACKMLKFHNRCLFVQEIQNTVQDLIYTKQERHSTDSEMDSKCTVSRLQDELLDVTVSDLQCIEGKLKPLIDEDYHQQIKNARIFLNALKHSPEYKSYISLVHYEWLFQRGHTKYKPQLLKLPLRSNFKDDLRPTQFICDIGFLMSLYHLHCSQKFFKRKYENIFLSSDLWSGNGRCMKFGACIKESLFYNSDSSKSNTTECHRFLIEVPKSSKNVLQDCSKYMDSGYFDLVSQFYSVNLKNGFTCNLSTSNGISLKEDQYLANGVSGEGCEDAPKCPWHGSSIAGMMDIIDEMEEHCHGISSALEILQHCNHLADLLYSLLMGHCTIITGPLECAPTVRALVMVLSLVCPRDPGEALYAQPWREVTTTLQDLEGMALLGMPLLTDNRMEKLIPENVLAQVSMWNIKTDTFAGPTYKGILLCAISRRIRSIPPKGPLLATLISILADVEMKVLLWRAMCQKSNQGSVMCDKYFTSKGYSRNDLDILETLTTIVA